MNAPATSTQPAPQPSLVLDILTALDRAVKRQAWTSFDDLLALLDAHEEAPSAPDLHTALDDMRFAGWVGRGSAGYFITGPGQHHLRERLGLIHPPGDASMSRPIRCPECQAPEGTMHRADCPNHHAWDEGEARMEAIGPNGNDGEHYDTTGHQVTVLQAAVHPAGTTWLGHDATVVIEAKDEGAGPYLELSSWDGPAVINDLATLEAVASTARRLLTKAEAGEARQ